MLAVQKSPPSHSSGGDALSAFALGYEGVELALDGLRLESLAQE